MHPIVAHPVLRRTVALRAWWRPPCLRSPPAHGGDHHASGPPSPLAGEGVRGQGRPAQPTPTLPDAPLYRSRHGHLSEASKRGVGSPSPRLWRGGQGVRRVAARPPALPDHAEIGRSIGGDRKLLFMIYLLWL